MFEKPEDLEKTILAIATRARAASFSLGVSESDQRNAVLTHLATLIENEEESIGRANQKDLEKAREADLSQAMIDRLTLTPERIRGMANGIRQIVSLPDPIGEEIERLAPQNGLDIRKLRVPIGVIAIIYEARPNVTIDCAALCLKSGNACILRGGREAFHSNMALADLIGRALEIGGMSREAVQLVPTTDRTALRYLLRLDTLIHCVIPRGGEGLIRYVTENSTIPVIKHYTGVCTLYVDQFAEPDMAMRIAVNGKCQRPGVCNAIENLLIHRNAADAVLPDLAAELVANGVELRADDGASRILGNAGLDHKPATEEDWSTEYLDLILSVKVVDSVEEATAFINQYGSQHSDVIVTEDKTAADLFLKQVDSATVYWNASTRFTDGFEFGMGAEIGISTDRLHARGPMGLRELCTYKYVIFGKGQTR